MIQKVKAATGDNIHIVIDTISEEETQFTAIKALADGVPGRLIVILPPVEGISDVRMDVEVGCSSTFLLPLT
jgi:fructose-1,6-bisphosphatase